MVIRQAAEEVTPVAEAALPKFNPVKTAGARPLCTAAPTAQPTIPRAAPSAAPATIPPTTLRTAPSLTYSSCTTRSPTPPLTVHLSHPRMCAGGSSTESTCTVSSAHNVNTCTTLIACVAGASPTGSRDRSNSPSQTVEALPGSGSLLNRSVEAEEPVAQRDSNALPGFSNAFAQSPSSAATTEVEIEDEKPGVLNAFG